MEKMHFIYRNTLENYSMMNNEFLLDSSLTPQEKGTLAIILTNQEDWRIYPDEIAKRSKSSKSATLNYFKSLENAGYMRTIKKEFGRGKGALIYRFASDVKIKDSYFYGYVMPRFEEWYQEIEYPRLLEEFEKLSTE